MKTLIPHRHKKLEFFIADDIDICTFRDEVASMEHPFFTLKAGDTKTREYQNGRVNIKVRSLADLGLATIFDKDIWIYAISKLQEALNNNQKISQTITFTPYDFFITTNREIGGRTYKELEKSLSRLSGTRIQTNIIYSEDDKKIVDFGLIDKWELIEKRKGKTNVGMIEITLPNWLYKAITKTKVLKISPDYFRIRKAIDRRLYEIARKHCGNQNKFIISLKKLYLKTGSTSNLAKFKFNIKKLSKINDLPDYKIDYYIKKNNVIITNRSKKLKLYTYKKKSVFNIIQKEKNKKIKNIKENISKIDPIDKIKINVNIPKGFRG